MSRRPGRRRAAGLGAVLALAGACGDAASPHIDSVSPAAAAAGATVQITGERFCGGACATTAGAVDFGLEPPMLRAQVSAWSSTRIEVVVPASAPSGDTDIIVTVDGRSSNAVGFEVQ